jgi:hypothetical protein
MGLSPQKMTPMDSPSPVWSGLVMDAGIRIGRRNLVDPGDGGSGRRPVEPPC